MPASGGEAVRITPGDGDKPRESADGKWLYYAKGYPPPFSLWRMPVGGGGEAGEVRHKGKIYVGEQAAILHRETWQQAQGLLRQSQRGDPKRKKPGALLQDLLRCGVCGSRMVTSHSTKKNRRYGYYVCGKAQQEGAAACPGQSIPAGRLEGAILAGLGELAAVGP
jgi:Recombinase zinc beta ribbon domain